MKILNITPHDVVIEVKDRTITLGGDVILAPQGFVALEHTLEHWDPPFSHQRLTEEERNEIVSFASKELAKIGMKLEWDSSTILPISDLAQVAPHASGAPSDAELPLANFQATIQLSGRNMTAYVEVSRYAGPIFDGQDGLTYTVHVNRSWDDGVAISNQDRARLTSSLVGTVVPSQASNIILLWS
jgi:hypothetical protein